MLSPFEIALYGVVSPVLLPLAIWSLLHGSPAPQGPLARYYSAEPYLGLTGNLLLIALSLSALTKLARHFGYVDANVGNLLGLWFGVPCGILALATLVLLARAFFKVHRSGKNA